MHYSPVRYYIISDAVQLACFRPAASVRSEPGSNSHIYSNIKAVPCISSNYFLIKVINRNHHKNLPYILPYIHTHNIPIIRLHSS